MTIIDDDKPGFLAFQEKRQNIKHIGTEEKCSIIVERTNGSDGRITCQYETIELTDIVAHRSGKPGVDYVHTEGELVFEHNVCR